MKVYIEKIILKNFKRFKNFERDFTSNLNVFIGDNESGKSSILLAMDIVLSGSRNKVETIGLDNLFNIDVINNFLDSHRNISDLPELSIEIFLSKQGNFELDGKNNTLKEEREGLKLICKPRKDLSKEIKEILSNSETNFPFEYYEISFTTFADHSYSGYKRYTKHLLIDNTQISNEYATREYIKQMFSNNVDETEKSRFQNAYRQYKDSFKNDILKELNDDLKDFNFTIKTGSKSNLDTDLTISEEGITIENRGKGRQCFVKTKFALQGAKKGLDIVLLEEPENHLSHINMKRLIKEIVDSEDKQLFIATHSDLISSRLDLRNAILLNSSSVSSGALSNLTNETAEFFIKAPDNNILQFILSKKVLLVEGDAEYILLESFFEKVLGHNPEEYEIHIISVGGTKFKRYLEIAKLLKIKTAFITDNDKNYQKNCKERYKDYLVPDLIQLFSDSDDSRYTFEVALYQDNKNFYDKTFKPTKLSVQEFLLENKTHCALETLKKADDTLIVPEYIKDAILWISE
jgi:putative ATP-dependent endonuclease of OLD family